MSRVAAVGAAIAIGACGAAGYAAGGAVHDRDGGAPVAGGAAPLLAAGRAACVEEFERGYRLAADRARSDGHAAGAREGVQARRAHERRAARARARAERRRARHQARLNARFRPRSLTLEGERITDAGDSSGRDNASGESTLQLDAGEAGTLRWRVGRAATYVVSVRYSNDNYGPLEQVAASVDGAAVGSFAAQDTGGGGFGWDVFRTAGPIGSVSVGPGRHRLALSVSGGDGGGVEIDYVRLELRP